VSQVTATATAPTANADDALDMILDGLRNLTAADAMAAGARLQARVLRVLEQAGAMTVAARASFLRAFTAAQGYAEDGDYSPRSWLIHRTGVTRGTAVVHTAWARRAEAHPRIAAAMAHDGDLSESWGRVLCEWIDKLPADRRDDAARIVVDAARAGLGLADLLALIAEMFVRSVPSYLGGDGEDGEDGPGDPAEDRGVRLETTFRGAGVLNGDLTPECAALVGAVLDALAAPRGAGDTRTRAQRYHDGLADAMRRLTASGLLPDRAGHAVKALVHMTLAELRAMDGGSVLQAEWTAAAAARWAARRAAASVTGSDGGAWLAGPPAQAVACDAILVPVVTGDIDVGALEDLVRLCVQLDRLDHHDHHGQAPCSGNEPGPAPQDGHPGTAPGPAAAGGSEASLLLGGLSREALREELRESLRQAIIGKAVDLVSGPGGLASFLRRRELGARLGGPSLPLDIGHSSTIPAAIRTAVTLRDQHCQWAGGCDQPAAACEVHHLVHKANGGKTSVKTCGLYCSYHHETMIHRRGWTVTLNPDGTTTARSPDGTRVFRSHSPPARPG
jgi:hypothetical protein